MNPLSSPAVVDQVESTARREVTPCGDGQMVWRSWGHGPPLVLLHGDFGSWTHWIRNIVPLARRFRVLVPDMPGYGASAMPPEPYTPASLAGIIGDGLAELLPAAQQYRLAGFSFGGIIAGTLAAAEGARVERLVLIGPGGFSLPAQAMAPLRRIEPGMAADDNAAVHAHNLGVVMIAAPERVDALAVRIQQENIRQARVRGGPIPESDALLQVLPHIEATIAGIWGGRDALCHRNIFKREALLRQFQPELDFRVVPGAGHWVIYEAAGAVNTMLLEMLGREDIRPSCGPETRRR